MAPMQRLWQVRLWSFGDCLSLMQVDAVDVEAAVQRTIKFSGRFDRRPELLEFLEFDAADMRDHKHYEGEVHDGVVLPF